MNIKKAYQVVSDHFGKIVAIVGGMLMTLDVAGQGEHLKEIANSLFGEKGAQKVGIVLFAILVCRFVYASYKQAAKNAQIEALQTQVDALQKAHAELAAKTAVPSVAA